jgi:hypothetical protein
VDVGPGNDLLAALCMAYIFDRYQCQPLVTVFGNDPEEFESDDRSIASGEDLNNHNGKSKVEFSNVPNNVGGDGYRDGNDAEHGLGADDAVGNGDFYEQGDNNRNYQNHDNHDGSQQHQNIYGSDEPYNYTDANGNYVDENGDYVDNNHYNEPSGNYGNVNQEDAYDYPFDDHHNTYDDTPNNAYNDKHQAEMQEDLLHSDDHSHGKASKPEIV